MISAPIDIRANFIDWDEFERPKYFRKPSVDAMNKQGIIEYTKEFFIVLGDVPSDVRMLENCVYTEAIFIGYLNDPKQLPIYTEYYDMIIMNDGNLLAVDALVEYIVNENRDIEDIYHLISSQ